MCIPISSILLKILPVFLRSLGAGRRQRPALSRSPGRCGLPAAEPRRPRPPCAGSPRPRRVRLPRERGGRSVRGPRPPHGGAVSTWTGPGGRERAPLCLPWNNSPGNVSDKPNRCYSGAGTGGARCSAPAEGVSASPVGAEPGGIGARVRGTSRARSHLGLVPPSPSPSHSSPSPSGEVCKECDGECKAADADVKLRLCSGPRSCATAPSRRPCQRSSAPLAPGVPVGGRTQCRVILPPSRGSSLRGGGGSSAAPASRPGRSVTALRQRRRARPAGLRSRRAPPPPAGSPPPQPRAHPRLRGTVPRQSLPVQFPRGFSPPERGTKLPVPLSFVRLCWRSGAGKAAAGCQRSPLHLQRAAGAGGSGSVVCSSLGRGERTLEVMQ